VDTPPITPEQAAQVDAVLARQEDYLKRLGARLKAIGVKSPCCLPGWVEKAEWSVSGVRIHFAEWARGKTPFALPRQEVPAWQAALKKE
jgi:hypothetical protein